MPHAHDSGSETAHQALCVRQNHAVRRCVVLRSRVDMLWRQVCSKYRVYYSKAVMGTNAEDYLIDQYAHPLFAN
eukprot:589675-Rhodomonas_salina.1